MGTCEQMFNKTKKMKVFTMIHILQIMLDTNNTLLKYLLKKKYYFNTF